MNASANTTVIIVGGGPAGAATALQLAKRGVASRVLEASASFHAKIGETLPPNSAPLLERMGLTHLMQDKTHLRCYSNQFIWGGTSVKEKLFFSNTHANGWHIDRARFESQLAAQAQQNTLATWEMACKMLRASVGPDQQWQVEMEQNGRCQTLRGAFLVDATGRAAKIARAAGSIRLEMDNLVGLASSFKMTEQIPNITSIEAVANGWWYAAPLSDKRLVTVFMTDADLAAKMPRTAKTYWHALQQTQLISSLLPGESPGPEVAPVTHVASSAHLNNIVGDNWLAVGDAAYAYDPLSSYGITSAIGGGFYAGNAIADHLLGKTEALPAYQFLLAQTYTQYLQMLGNQYRLEQRWPNEVFWQRRHDSAADRFQATLR